MGHGALPVGDPETAIADLQHLVDRARAAGDRVAEAEADLLLWDTYRGIGAIGDEPARLLRRHLARAEAGFRDVGDEDGLARALARAIHQAVDDGEQASAEYGVWKLDAVRPDLAVWLRAFVAATLGDDVDANARSYEECVRTADVHGADADHWRHECSAKLAILRGEVPPRAASPTAHRFFTSAIARLTRGEAEADVLGELLAGIEAAETVRRTIRSEVKQRELSATFSPLYATTAALLVEDGRYVEALDVLEGNTSRSLLSREAMSWLWARSGSRLTDTDEHASARRVLAAMRMRRGTDRDLVANGAPDSTRLDTVLRRHRQIVHDVEERLVRSVPAPHERFHPVSVEEVRAVLSPNDAIVAFAHDAFCVLTRDGVKCVARVNIDSADGACTSWHHAASHGEDCTAAATTIDHLLVRPLAQALDGRRRVFVVPRGAMWRIPLATFGAEPLAARHDVAIVPNLSLASRRVVARPRREPEPFFGLADPDGSLPAAIREVRTAASRFVSASVAVGDTIDLCDVRAGIETADVIHFACHGGYFDEYPELAFLHVAGRRDEREMLWVQDLVRSRVRARVVVLAACHAGTAVALPGDEYIGFPGAWLAAGAACVAAPLWAVDDASTSELMDAFYSELAAGASPARSLWRAQERLRDRPATAHPYHWAAFQLFGQP